MKIKSLLVMVNAGILSLGLTIAHVNAAVVTLADYLVLPKPGDSWTYRTNMDSNLDLSTGPVFYQAATDFTVTEPWYVNYTLLPDVAETGMAILVESPNISIYLDIIPEITLPTGTFNDVLRMTWLDSNFDANSINTSLGIDSTINEGVTDINWLALDVGEISFLGVNAADGSFDGGYDLLSYTISNVPIPAAVWLFGTGLIGLIGVARRKK